MLKTETCRCCVLRARNWVGVDRSGLHVKMWVASERPESAAVSGYHVKQEDIHMAVAAAEEKKIQMMTDRVAVAMVPPAVEHIEQTSRSPLVRSIPQKRYKPDKLHALHTGASSHSGVVDSHCEGFEADCRSGKSGSCPEVVVSGHHDDFGSCMPDGFADCEVRRKDEAWVCKGPGAAVVLKSFH